MFNKQFQYSVVTVKGPIPAPFQVDDGTDALSLSTNDGNFHSSSQIVSSGSTNANTEQRAKLVKVVNNLV